MTQAQVQQAKYNAAIAKAKQFKAEGDDEAGMTWLTIAIHHERMAQLCIKVGI